MQNGHASSIVMFAALEIGAVVVPVSWQLTPYEMKGILAACEPKAVFSALNLKRLWKKFFLRWYLLLN